MSSGDDKQRKALGKGLSALLPARAPQPPTAAPAVQKASPLLLQINAIRPNPVQPRTTFRADRLEELAASIRAHGIIQPLIVRETENGYQLVAGERRWRAAQMAGLTEVPVVIQDVADPVLLEVALIENLQREDLNPIETAQAYDRLVKDLGLSQEEIARRTGKDRTSIANTLRLLRLPSQIQSLIADHRISMGHAKAILSLPSPDDQIALANKVAAQGLSVRQVEALVQQETSDDRPRHTRREGTEDPNVRAAVDSLEQALGTRVRIVALNEQRGRFEIEYYSAGERDRIYNYLISYSE